MDPETARLGRAVRKLQVAVALLGSSVVALGGYAAWLTTRIDEDPPGRLVELRTGRRGYPRRLHPGSSAVVRTEAGLRVSVTLAEFTWRQGPVATLEVEGMPAGRTAGRWYFYLYDDTRLRLETEELGNGRVRVSLSGSLPATGKVRFLQLDVDDSHGDLYFDVNQQ
ncbi:MAG: hypothetical protein IPG47_12485 [Thermoflexaceae bacterium]|nr:hypothetical protein [Thermoflexaceae bacterium]